MLTRSRSDVLLAVVGSLVVSTAFGQSPQSQPPSTGRPAGSSAQASGQAFGQGAATVGRSGVSAQASGSSEAAAHAGDGGTELAAESSVNAVLTKPVDSRKSKPGDPVTARTTQPGRTSDGTQIPTGSTLMGHVSETRVRGEGHSDSAVGIVFDKAVTKDGRDIALRNVSIRALAAAESAASGSVAAGGMMPGAGMGAGGMGAGGMSAGRGVGGGGLVGRSAGAVGGTLGGGLGAAGSVTGSVWGPAGGALQAAPGATGGLDASGFLTAGSSGVFGLRDLSLSTATSSASQASLVTSTGKSLHLDQGTRLLLSSEAKGSSHPDRERATRESSASERSRPDHR